LRPFEEDVLPYYVRFRVFFIVATWICYSSKMGFSKGVREDDLKWLDVDSVAELS
jgi:hypothetical protein